MRYRPRRPRKPDPKDAPFDCVECNRHVVPAHPMDRPLVYHSMVTAKERKPGPHCRRCVDAFSQAVLAKSRQEAFEREQARIALFDTSSKPQDVSDYTWNAMRAYACCLKARPSPCVCTHSFSCPDHGATHVGTHD